MGTRTNRALCDALEHLRSINTHEILANPSLQVPEGAVPVEGLDFSHYADKNISAAEMVEKMCNMGFQASSIGQAAQIVDGMVGTIQHRAPSSSPQGSEAE